MYAKHIFEKHTISGKGRQVPYKYITKICRTLISYVHTLYSINYGIKVSEINMFWSNCCDSRNVISPSRWYSVSRDGPEVTYM